MLQYNMQPVHAKAFVRDYVTGKTSYTMKHLHLDFTLKHGVCLYDKILISYIHSSHNLKIRTKNRL